MRACGPPDRFGTSVRCIAMVAGPSRRLVVRVALAATIALFTIGCRGSNDASTTDKSAHKHEPVRTLILPDNLASLADSLHAEAPADRAYAASQLEKLGSEARPAAPILLDALKDPNWQVRCQAADALGALGDIQAVNPLIEVLSDRNGDWSVRAAAARALGRLGDARAVEPLISVLNDMNAHVRHMAVVALGEIGTPDTVEPLTMAAQSDSDTAIRFAADQALRVIRRPKTGDSEGNS